MLLLLLVMRGDGLTGGKAGEGLEMTGWWADEFFLARGEHLLRLPMDRPAKGRAVELTAGASDALWSVGWEVTADR